MAHRLRLTDTLKKLTAAKLFSAVFQTTRYYKDKYVSTDGM